MKDFCKAGEILYPGDQLDDWVCDCKPGNFVHHSFESNFEFYIHSLTFECVFLFPFEAYIYHPDKQQCYEAYTRGPCKQGHFLVLPPNHVVPACQENSCEKDNFVPFRNGCYKLDQPGPCDLGSEISNLVGVNETTLQIICTKDDKLNTLKNKNTDITSRIDDEDDSFKTTNSIAINVNGEKQACTLAVEKKCFVGGIRWTQTRCATQNSSSPTHASQIDENLQSVFSKPA